jgi:hypothetical protein
MSGTTTTGWGTTELEQIAAAFTAGPEARDNASVITIGRVKGALELLAAEQSLYERVDTIINPPTAGPFSRVSVEQIIPLGRPGDEAPLDVVYQYRSFGSKTSYWTYLAAGERTHSVWESMPEAMLGWIAAQRGNTDVVNTVIYALRTLTPPALL